MGGMLRPRRFGPGSRRLRPASAWNLSRHVRRREAGLWAMGEPRARPGGCDAGRAEPAFGIDSGALRYWPDASDRLRFPGQPRPPAPFPCLDTAPVADRLVARLCPAAVRRVARPRAGHRFRRRAAGRRGAEGLGAGAGPRPDRDPLDDCRGLLPVPAPHGRAGRAGVPGGSAAAARWPATYRRILRRGGDLPPSGHRGAGRRSGRRHRGHRGRGEIPGLRRRRHLLSATDPDPACRPAPPLRCRRYPPGQRRRLRRVRPGPRRQRRRTHADADRRQ